MSTTARSGRPRSSPPGYSHFPSENFVQGGGVAIFHLATARVVICSAEDRRVGLYYFLPKGRRDAGEDAARGAEREGYEESGYRNRLLPLPIKHKQPQAFPRVSASSLTAEPIWLEVMPVTPTIQYLLYWYVAETIPPQFEKELETEAGAAYKPPPPYPNDLTLQDRVKMEPKGYEPVRHEGTGVDEEEQTYKSYLMSIDEAVQKLGKTGIMADVVLRGWQGIQDRYKLEEVIDPHNLEQTG